MKVYADNAATTAMSPAALSGMIPALQTLYGNPSSLHTVGQDAAEALEAARASIAEDIGAQPEEIYFTSGGTEADNWALYAGAKLGAAKGKHQIISSAFEHHAVLHTLDKLAKEGSEIVLLDVHEDGVIRLEELAAAITDNTAMVSVLYANNEIGTVQPIAEIGALCRERGVLFHTDAVQAVGHIPVHVHTENIDMLSLSGHKFHGPKGVGALYCRKGIRLPVFIEGGAQERGKRGGTEAVPAILGMAAALREAVQGLHTSIPRVSALRDTLMRELAKIDHSRLNGHPEKRLPGIVSFCFEGIEGESLLLKLDLAGIAASSGSACTSGSLDPSHVLLALGMPHEVAHGSLRLSLSELNTPEEINYILQTLPPIVAALRDMSPMWEKMQKEEKRNHGIQ